MASKKLNYGGIINICDTTTKTTADNVPAGCFPYWIDGNIADSVELNRIKQAYNTHTASYVSKYPVRHIYIPPSYSAPIREYVKSILEQVRALSTVSTIYVTGYVSYAFTQNCVHGRFFDNEHGQTDNECEHCYEARIRREHYNSKGEYIGDGSGVWG